ncbi:hypothetical protein ABZX65_27080 [Streptomyces sp. NPDC003300]|uniref:hypothetical protein n=1 Tax=unclassified Streptomyces TaxID=2593676 RepID=UPI0033B4B279
MKPSRWTLLSWAVTFGAHGLDIAVIGSMTLAAILGGTWWNDRRTRLRHQAIERAHNAAPRPAPSWAHPHLADHGDWERLYNAVHQHGQRGDDDQTRQQCEAIWQEENR